MDTDKKNRDGSHAGFRLTRHRHGHKVSASKQENTLMASFLFVPMNDTSRAWNVSVSGRSSEDVLAAARKFCKEYRNRYMPLSEAVLMFEAGRAFQRYAEVNGSVEKSLDVNLLSRMGTLSFDPA